ncbi:FCD domain protein [Acetobacteraceae bacterium AT-5844]|nr:FCD domain protein [Acetobacteraceae bacterium AT-5844]
MAETIARPSLADHVVASLTRSISDGRMPPGARLPTGQQLAEQFGVSLAVIREAISSLKAEGLIETRQGAGAFVAAPSANRPFRIQPELASAPNAARMIFELRMGAEVSAAALAAARATRGQLAELRRAHREMEKAIAAGGNGVEEDLQFHRGIAEAANNPLFVAFVGFLGHHIRDSISLSRPTGTPWEAAEVLGEHEAILEAILRRDVEAAQQAAWNHMNNCLARCAK